MTRSVRIVLVVLALSHMAALAWESDVHYLLTWWLATQAGFSRGDADTIAAADQSYDTSPHHAAVPNMVWILANNDSGAARDLQRKHFPSDARLPSPPMRRVVVPNSQQARIAVESAIRPTNSATALQEFGEGLHPFEDSWSHQGVPDTPLRPALQLRPELGCAHPEARGGWWSHDADYTYLHVEEVKEMARKTYELMSRFLDENPRMREHPAVNWTKLVGIVQEFAVAQAQSQKNAWAVKYVPTSPSQLSMSLTLPGTRSGTGAHAIRPPEGFRAVDVPPELVKNANHFAELWITKQDIPQAVETYVELGALGKQWANFPGLDRGRREDITRWSRKFMTMYLVADHGAVNAAGHGNPSSPGYGELPETAIREGRFRALSNLSVAPISSVDFDRVQDFLDGPFALAIQPDGLQHDAAFFVWSNTPGGWRIINMFPIVD